MITTWYTLDQVSCRNKINIFKILNFSTIADHTLVRLDKNGSNPLVLYNNSEIVIHQLTLDYFEKNVYWIERNRSNANREICFVNIYGGEVKKLKFNESPNYSEKVISYKHLEVDQKYVYYLAKLNENDTDYYLLRANKFNGEFDRDFGLSEHYNPEKNDTGFVLRLSKTIILVPQDHSDTNILRKFLNWIYKVIGLN